LAIFTFPFALVGSASLAKFVMHRRILQHELRESIMRS
jgi:hypothetical protein